MTTAWMISALPYITDVTWNADKKSLANGKLGQAINARPYRSDLVV
jgi:hypothetical protein